MGRAPRRRGRLFAGAASPLLTTLLVACASPDPTPTRPLEQEVTTVGDVASDGVASDGTSVASESADRVPIAQDGAPPRPELPPTDFLDFPAAPDLLPRDYEMEEPVGSPLAGYVTRFYRVRSLNGLELIGILSNWKSPNARIVNIPQHNMLVITELRERMATLDKVLAQVDLVPPQVEIEAKVLEILTTSGYEFGFELHADKAPAGDTALRRYDGVFNSDSFLSSFTNQAAPFQGASMNFAAVGTVVEEIGDFDVIIRALETDGYAEVVSAPRVVCRSGQRAILRTATKLPIQDFLVQSTNNVRIGTRFESVGVTLEVAPTVVGRDAITVEVKPMVSNVIRFENSPATGGIPVPVIEERAASTQLDIRNGELLVIGGLLDSQRREDHRRVPILGHIPLIGQFFGTTNDFEQKTNVVFILRIRILTSAEKARGRDEIPLTREERARLEEQNAEDAEDTPHSPLPSPRPKPKPPEQPR